MAPGIRQADHKEARVACAAASSSSAPWRSPVPEFLPRRPNWVSLLARAASLSRTPPPHGQVPYWVRSRLAEGCLRDLFSRDFHERLPVVAWRISATGARAGALAREGVVRCRPGQRLQGDRGGSSLEPQCRLLHFPEARRSRRA
ncbi:hypothetical protein ACRRTK_022252 [Alexandromys fortis]